jgi:hypothetical protein
MYERIIGSMVLKGEVSLLNNMEQEKKMLYLFSFISLKINESNKRNIIKTFTHSFKQHSLNIMYETVYYLDIIIKNSLIKLIVRNNILK